VKYPDEEIHVIREAIIKHCRPLLEVDLSVIPVSPKKFVVRIGVPVSARRPHRFVQTGSPAETFVRVKDSSVKASRELVEIIRRMKSQKDVKFAYGPHESTLIKYLEEHGHITVQQFSRIARVSRHLAARKLIRLVLARVLKVTPAQPDLYSRL
jgi:predicted HTH transcriptional regulator